MSGLLGEAKERTQPGRPRTSGQQAPHPRRRAGIPLAVSLTGGNRNDVIQLMPLLAKIPSVPGLVGRPRRRPDVLLGDRGYDHDKYRRLVRAQGIKPVIARRGVPHGSGLGPHLPIGRCGKEWTDDGAAHEVHSLKRRAANATRPVPIPPQFVHILLAHMERFGASPDGRVFRNESGNHVDTAAYGTTWARARESALTPTEYASGLAKRPYDLRHAGISFWLYSGVDPAECARRAGQSIQVLFRHYANSWTASGNSPTASSSSPCRSGTGSATARRLWDEPRLGPAIDRNSWSGAGQAGRNWEMRNKPGPVVRGGSGRCPTGERTRSGTFFPRP
ncbi:Transposase DDE domain protein [Streptomyces sp. S4.7]|nr:Transposase DDE domain protein [Streptomyces sp. S4.7]